MKVGEWLLITHDANYVYVYKDYHGSCSVGLRFRLNCEICGRETGTCKCWNGYDVPAQENEVGHSQHELSINKKLNVKEEKQEMVNGWETGFAIKTPKGDYKPKSDDLAAEIKAAARYAGVKHPNVSVGFDTIESPADLPVACISGLDEGTVVEVSAYDEAGK